MNKRIAWLLLALLFIDWSPGIPPFPDETQAQAQIPMLAQGLVMTTNASVNAANTTSEILLYQYQLPAALLASWTTTNTAFGSTPLHLRLNGTIQASGGAPVASLGVNLTPLGSAQSSSVATLAIINGAAMQQDIGRGTACNGSANASPGACAAPFWIDVMLSPIATVTTQNCTDLRPCNASIYFAGQAQYASLSGTSAATLTSYNAASLAAVNINQPMVINVNWRWGVAASINSVNIYNGELKLGF